MRETATTKPATHRSPAKTCASLLDAARLEFEEAGFEETNTNRIARRAGFAPQTFYRHFPDKTSIFLAVYERWVDEEVAAVGVAEDATGAADIIIRHHRASLKFRRTLRSLTLTDARVREARARSRLAQIGLLRQRFARLAARDPGDLAFNLLTIERLTDAHVEGELQDLGIPESVSRAELIRRLAQELDIPLNRCCDDTNSVERGGPSR